MKTTVRLCILLYLAFERSPLFGAEEALTPKVVLVARVGKLAPQEVSPRSQSSTPTIWDLARVGVTYTQIELPGSGPGPTLGALDLSLFPQPARASSESPAASPAVPPRGRSWVVLDVSGEPPAEASSSKADGNPLPPALEALMARFRPPPSPRGEEVAHVLSLRRAMGAPLQAYPLLSFSPRKAESLRDQDILWARVALVRMGAQTDTESAARFRDGLLARIVRLAGEGACVAVLNWPLSGPGTLVLSRTGPESSKSFLAGRVQSTKKSLAEVSAVLKDFLEKREPGAPLTRPEMPEDEAHELPK